MAPPNKEMELTFKMCHCFCKEKSKASATFPCSSSPTLGVVGRHNAFLVNATTKSVALRAMMFLSVFALSVPRAYPVGMVLIDAIAVLYPDPLPNTPMWRLAL